MKKNILRMTLAAAFVCAAGFTAYRAQTGAPELSGLALENVEALANDESGVYKKGYEASTYKWFASSIHEFTTIPCCKYNGNSYSGCSAIDICPK